MTQGYRVAIVGATGLVGRTMATVLCERHFPVRSLRMFASARSAGSSLEWNGRSIVVEEARPDAFADIDLALFSAGASTSRELAPAAVAAGAIVVDNSSAWRMDPDIPLVVPEVNPDDVAWNKGIIANPNCSTIQMVVALDPLHRARGIRRIVVDTYQSVGGTGNKGVAELREQVAQDAAGVALTPNVYPHPIAFNLVPQIDSFLPDGSTKEEAKMVNETRKIMHAPLIKVIATTVRVPVLCAHSEAVHVGFERPITPDEAREFLRRAPGVIVEDDPSRSIYPTPRDKIGRDEVFVGRIRSNDVFENGLSMWIVADNIRKGAATNAVQIAEELARRGLLANRKERLNVVRG
ncbi:MAG: aspartate-semialdehyde dehydrogenase [Chloroflexota bacterium]|nr:MAG: aspartate-semialdehyde dehydrogenase [Chloroflexota bacterium]